MHPVLVLLAFSQQLLLIQVLALDISLVVGKMEPLQISVEGQQCCLTLHVI